MKTLSVGWAGAIPRGVAASLGTRALSAASAVATRLESATGLQLPGSWTLLRAAYSAMRLREPFWIRQRGVSYLLDPADSVITPTVITGRYEAGEIGLLKRLLGRGETFVDVGANFGYFALFAGRRVGPRGRVVAFEPEPSNFARLERGVDANGLRNVTVVPAAVSADPGRAELYISSRNLGGHSMSALNVPDRGSKVLVPTVTLDGELGGLGLVDQVAVLKMDVQGAEAAVLDGGRRTLRESRPTILMEFWPEGLRKFGADPRRMLSNLVDGGYGLSVVERRSGRLVPAEFDQLTDHMSDQEPDAGEVNLLLVPEA